VADEELVRRFSSVSELSVEKIKERFGPAALPVLLATGKQKAGCVGFSYHGNGGADGGGVSLVYAHEPRQAAAAR